MIGTYVVTADDVVAGVIPNTATADSLETEQVTGEVSVPVAAPSLAITKPAPTNIDNDGTGGITAGDVLTYTITATNDGGAALTDVQVLDSLITPTGGTTPCALLISGATCTLIGTYVVTVEDAVAGFVANTASAQSNQTPPVEDSVISPVLSPELSIDKPAPVNDDHDNSGDISVGDTLTYTITATNTGSSALTNVIIIDDLVARIGGSSPCALLLPDETCTLVGTYAVTGADVDAGEVTNTATAASDQTAPVEDSVTVNIDAEAALSIDKPAPVNSDSDSSNTITAGDTLTYTITATNTGDTTLTNVVVDDSLIVRTGGTSPCASVAPGQTCTLVGTYLVTVADETTGRVDNQATARSDQTPAISDEVTVFVLSLIHI